ncbi:hypothetical protein [Subtercola vilae]|uniref:NERD domain-containing protein n=1 Tax=Subtercola vilae TaxID=2056433 RepID=A0A4T2BC12_9MICO|nr:hypothetical protein [Subtercola vilae]TIH28607.1 hypothetical protein D4765_18430 [Subtercola vilae]
MGFFSDDGDSSRFVDEAKQKFGEERYEVGAKGELFMSRGFNTNRLTKDYAKFTSLSVPASMTDRSEMKGDIDICLVSGNRVLMIDIKAWNPRYVYWTIPVLKRPMRGIRPLRKDDSEWALSKQMELGVERYSKALPQATVKAIVVFAPTNGQNTVPLSVGLLVFPGGIRSYLARQSYKIARDFLGEPEAADPAVTQFLMKMKR